MKKSFCDRIKAIELRHENRQINEPSIYVDNETGLTMQVIGNGLVVSAPVALKHWVEWVDKYYRGQAAHNATQHKIAKSPARINHKRLFLNSLGFFIVRRKRSKKGFHCSERVEIAN